MRDAVSFYQPEVGKTLLDIVESPFLGGNYWPLALGPGLPLMILPAIFVEPPPNSEAAGDPGWRIMVAVIFGLPWIACVYSLFFQPRPELPEDERRAKVKPLGPMNCCLCGGALRAEPELHCPQCAVRVFARELEQPPPLPGNQRIGPCQLRLCGKLSPLLGRPLGFLLLLGLLLLAVARLAGVGDGFGLSAFVALLLHPGIEAVG